MSRTLVLFTDNQSYYFDRIHSSELTIRGLYYDHAELKNPVLKFLRKIKSPFTRLFYQDWYQHLKDYEKIIVLDTALLFDGRLLYNISRKAPDARKYFYSWNKVKDEARFEEGKRAADQAGFKYYSYDKGDCRKYGLNFNTIMYDPTLTLEEAEPQYDILFLGFLKDRKKDLLLLHRMLRAASLKPNFMIVNYQKEHEELPFTFTDKYIPYYDYLKLVSNSRAILDISQEGQDGYSMRVMEAIFFQKKLITTNTAVRDSMFYNDSNILIIDFDRTTTEEIHAFYEKPFQPYDEKIRQYYSIGAWADRFED